MKGLYVTLHCSVQIIKNPIDIGTIEKYLMSYLYRPCYTCQHDLPLIDVACCSSLDEFAADMRLCFKNAKRYNLEGSDIHKMAPDISGSTSDLYS